MKPRHDRTGRGSSAGAGRWLGLLVAAVVVVSFVRADEYDDLRLRWTSALNGGPSLDTADPDVADELGDLAASAQSYWNSMDKSAGRTALWSDANQMATLSSHITTTYNRLRTMATALATPGCSLAGNPTLKVDLLSALDWMYATYYNETKTEYYNWWDWQIGTPLALNDITALLYADLSATQTAHYMTAVNKFTPSPTLTGANLVWKATVVAVRGVIVKDSAKIAAARDSLGSVFAYVTSGDGFSTDGSFVQHSYHPYTGGYGASLIANLGPLLSTLSGSTWQVTDSRQANLFRWIHDSFGPVIYKGAMPDMLRGREIARTGSGDHGSGGSIIASIIRIAQFAPADDALAFKRMAKYWIQADTSRGFLANASLAVIPIAKAILDDPAITPSGERVGFYNFPKMDRVMHLRPGFGLGLSVSSTRIATYESINQENLRAWYSGDGMTYLYNNDLTQFNDNFWCTVNPYRLPGTTVDTVSRADASGQSTRPAQTWVGGVSLGLYGAEGMQLAAWSNGLTAKKSWFFFDDEVVCLGADIRSTSGRTIETTVENRRLAGTGNQALTVNGTAQATNLGWSASLGAVNSAHLAGDTAGADIGYYFPQAVSLQALREARSGTWYAINNRSGSTTSYTRNYLTLWFNHGASPTGATYAYALLPNKSASQVAAYATQPDFAVLENNASAQTVRESRLGITAANFWADASWTSGGVTVDRKAAVLVQDDGTEVTLAVADPTQANTGTVTVEWAAALERPLSIDARITVLQLKPTLRLSVNVSGAAGQSIKGSFTRAQIPNQAPTPGADSKSAVPGTPVLLDVLTNDTDPDFGPSPLSLVSVGPSSHGQTSISGAFIRYVPSGDFAGPDAFSYTVTDGEATASATVGVSVGTGPVSGFVLTASTFQDPNVPAHVLDGDLNTRWSAQGDGQWLTCQWSTPHLIDAVGLAFYQGNTRTASFDVLVSPNGTNWTTLGAFASNGTTNSVQVFDLTDTWTQWLRIVGHGNSVSNWNSITELQVLPKANQAPVVVGSAWQTDEGLVVEIDWVALATDPDGGPSPLDLLATGTPAHGSIEVVGTMVRYTPAPAFTGTDSFTLTVGDGALATTATISIDVRNARTFDGFRNQFFDTGALADPATSGPQADPDHDGLPNWLEYAFVLDPQHGDAAPVVVVAGPGSFRYTYTRRRLATDLEYVPEMSVDGSTWEAAGAAVAQSVLSETESTQRVEVKETALAPASRRFHRLRVNQLLYAAAHQDL